MTQNLLQLPMQTSQGDVEQEKGPCHEKIREAQPEASALGVLKPHGLPLLSLSAPAGARLLIKAQLPPPVMSFFCGAAVYKALTIQPPAVR